MTDLVEGFEINTDLLLTEEEQLTFSGRRSKFTHKQVLTNNKCLEMTGVLPKLIEWRDEDRQGRKRSGPAPYVSDRAILVAMLLLAREHAPLNETAIAEVLHQRLTDESREYLGLPYALPPIRDNRGGTEEKNWQNHAHNGLQRILEPIDPHPDTKGTRRKLLNNSEREAISSARDLNTMRRRKERLDWFSQAFIQMTFTMQPRRLRRLQRVANVSVDQTPVPVYTKKGRRKHPETGEYLERKVKEIDAAWYKKGDDWIWGYAANFAVSTANEGGKPANFPITIRAFTLSVPTIDIPGEAVKLGKQLIDAGHLAGRFAVDRGYSSNSTVHDYHKPITALGYKHVFDFDKDEVGKKAGGQKGTIYVEGAHLCPGTPEELVNLTIDANNLEYDEPTYRRLIDERAQYEARYKESGTRPGTHKYMCPALGKQARIECPLREIHPEASKKVKPYVLNRNLPKRLDKICTQHSVTIEENDDTVKSKQEFRYGSREWATNYEADRNMVEGMNGFIKAENKEALASAARRSAFGLAAQQVLVTMLIVSANMRKLQSFLKDEIRAAKMKIDMMIEKRRLRLRDHPEKGWGRYKRKWGPPRAEISVPGRDSPLQIVPLKT